jgi:hypothetical protein
MHFQNALAIALKDRPVLDKSKVVAWGWLLPDALAIA